MSSSPGADWQINWVDEEGNPRVAQLADPPSVLADQSPPIAAAPGRSKTLICTQCKTRNSAVNKFCRECGAKIEMPSALSVEETERVVAERTQERAAGLLAQAFTLAEEDKPDEALPLAQAALALLPDSTSSLALLAVLYERLGHTEKALAAMERVVALNPGSEADKQRLRDLEAALRQRGAVAPVTDGSTAPRRVPPRPKTAVAALPWWTPYVAAVTCGGLALVVGLSVLNQDDTTPAAAARQVASAPGATVTASPVEAGGAIPAPGAAAIGGSARPDPFTPLAGGNRSGTSAFVAAGRPAATTPPPATLPPLLFGSGSAGSRSASSPRTTGRRGGAAGGAYYGRTLPPLAGGVAPAPVTPGGAVERFAVRPPSAGEGSGSDTIRIAASPPFSSGSPSNGGASNADVNSSTVATPPRPEGYIRIQVGPPSSPQQKTAPAAPPASAAPAPPPGESAMQRAHGLQASGRYDESASAYQQALGGAAGIARGDAYQGIAFAQRRKGNVEAARAAYRQAIAAYEAAQTQNPNAARQGIATCRAALEALDG